MTQHDHNTTATPVELAGPLVFQKSLLDAAEGDTAVHGVVVQGEGVQIARINAGQDHAIVMALLKQPKS
jgi:hypothetical protein